MKIRNHRVEAEADDHVTFQRSPNQSSPITPIYLLMHYTAGTTLDGAVSWSLNPAAQASSHLLVGPTGIIAARQLPLHRRARPRRCQPRPQDRSRSAVPDEQLSVESAGTRLNPLIT